jgi:transcriptional regulatory protein LevR
VSLELRIQLLLGSGQISQEVAELTREVMRRVERVFGVTLTEENGAMFVTHLALALERLRKGQPVKSMPPEALAEVQTYTREWEFITAVTGEIGWRLGVPVPIEEAGFLTAHLATLVHLAAQP